MNIDYEKYARKIIQEMVGRVLNQSIIEKTISYSDLAKEIDFPQPYVGSEFSGNIGRTLGSVGELLETVKLDNWNKPIPIIQSMVVSKTSGLPSYGLRAFVPNYDKLPEKEQKTFVLSEHSKIIQFGDRWLDVLKKLNIEPIDVASTTKTNLYNPYGSEGSPEHIKVKEYIKKYHHLLGYTGVEEGIEEYPLLSGDKIDVVFRDKDTIYAYEAKSFRSDLDDIERGIFQCVKYREVIQAETKVGARETTKVVCSLVTETELSKELQKYCEVLGIKYYKVKAN